MCSCAGRSRAPCTQGTVPVVKPGSMVSQKGGLLSVCTNTVPCCAPCRWLHTTLGLSVYPSLRSLVSNVVRPMLSAPAVLALAPRPSPSHHTPNPACSPLPAGPPTALVSPESSVESAVLSGPGGHPIEICRIASDRRLIGNGDCLIGIFMIVRPSLPAEPDRYGTTAALACIDLARVRMNFFLEKN